MPPVQYLNNALNKTIEPSSDGSERTAVAAIGSTPFRRDPMASGLCGNVFQLLIHSFNPLIEGAASLNKPCT
jgi:hypothetical protein